MSTARGVNSPGAQIVRVGQAGNEVQRSNAHAGNTLSLADDLDRQADEKMRLAHRRGLDRESKERAKGYVEGLRHAAREIRAWENVKDMSRLRLAP